MILTKKLDAYLSSINGNKIDFKVVFVGFDYIEVMVLDQSFMYRLEAGKIKLVF